MQSSNISRHRKSETFDTFDEIWDDAEDITESCLRLDETNSNYFLTFNYDRVVSGSEDSSSNILRCSRLDINEVLAVDRFQVHHRFHFSPKHLPATPSNLLKSDINLINENSDTETEDAKTQDETEDELLSLSKSSQKEDEILSTDLEASQPNYDQVPIAGALFVATCLGTPVIALTGLKMGMFAAMGGGIMGFATGKMFAEHEENKALAMGHDNNASAQTKKKKTLKRIYEWQRFEANCQIVKDLDDEQIIRISEIHKEMSKQSTPVRPRSGKRKES